MKSTRRIAVAALALLAAASLIAAICSFWYLWHLASRVRDPGRGLIHPVLLGPVEKPFTVYLNSTESVFVFPELYLMIFAAALVMLLPFLWWRMPLQKRET